MKVCHVTIYHPRLDRRIFHKECFALRDVGHDVYLIAPGGDQAREVIDGITVIRGPGLTRPMRQFLPACNQVLEMARELDADVYHLHDFWLLPFGFKAKRKLKCKVIFDAHEDYPARYRSFSRLPRLMAKTMGCFVGWYEKRAGRKFDGFVTVCKSTYERTESVGGRAVMVRNYVPASSYPDAPATMNEYGNRGKVILHTGCLAVSRGSRAMVEAAAILKRRGVEFQLLIVDRFNPSAERDRNETVRLISELKVEDRVKMVPQVSFDRLGELLKRAAVGISILPDLPGIDVATPTKLFEYMAYSIPIVGYRVPGHAEVVEGHDCGWLFDHFSSESLADCLEEALDSSDTRYQKAINGFHAFRNHYCWEAEAARLAEFYTRL